MASINWKALGTHLIEFDATDKFRHRSDEDGTTWLESVLANEDYDLIFFGNDDVDEAGHSYGFTLEHPEYLA